MLLRKIYSMKKLMLSVFFMIGFSFLVFSQEENITPIEKHHQFGLNVGSLVKSLSNKNDVPSLQETFTYKYIKGNTALRTGLGLFIQKEIKDEFGDNLDRISLALRLGFEKQKHISNKWQYYYGLDIKAKGFIEDSFNFFDGEDVDMLKSFSLSPLLGFQFRLTPHLLLQTEASIDFYYSESNNRFNDLILPIEPIFANENKLKGVNVTLPNALYLVVEF